LNIKLAYLVFVTCLFSQNIIVPKDDAYYYKLFNTYCLSSDLSLYYSPFPYDIEFLNKKIDVSNVQFGIIRQNINFSFGLLTPLTKIDTWASIYYDNWSLLFQPTVVNEKHSSEILGIDYVRWGWGIRNTNSIIRYSSGMIVFQLGRAPIWWGQSISSSIIQSGNSPPIDHVMVHIPFRNLRLNLIFGQLGSLFDSENNRIKRHIAAHRLDWISVNETLLISIGEQIIYTGINRGIEWVYINPIASIIFAGIEKEEELLGNHFDNDNKNLFLTGRYILSKKQSIYVELLIDEIQIDNSDKPNSIGWKIGVDYPSVIFENAFEWSFEITKTDKQLYLHPGQYTSWFNLNHPIGYKYGAGCKAILINLDYWLFSNITLSMSTTYLEKTITPHYYDWFFNAEGLTINKYNNYVSIYTSIQSNYGFLEFGYSNYPINDIEINGVLKNNIGSIYLKAQLVWSFGNHLDKHN